MLPYAFPRSRFGLTADPTLEGRRRGAMAQSLDAPFRVEIRFMFETVEMWVKPTDFIESVKGMIFDRHGIPVHCQRLYNNGIELDDDHTVGEYCIVGRILCHDTRGTLS